MKILLILAFLSVNIIAAPTLLKTHCKNLFFEREGVNIAITHILKKRNEFRDKDQSIKTLLHITTSLDNKHQDMRKKAKEEGCAI